MTSAYLDIGLSLGSAWIAGSIIGLERSFRGRPAGFRTHALVCLASALLMVVSIYQWEWFSAAPVETIRTDPTRMAQGIMTGIGFLGAGVIFKEGLSVRGLTTAASIWMTSALGILYGVGFYFPAIATTAVTIGTLSVFRWIEGKMPGQFYAHHYLRFAKDSTLPEPEVRALLAEHGFSVANMNYELHKGGDIFEYRMVISTLDPANLGRLAKTLRGKPQILEFRIAVRGK